ncbi:MAG: branched chain amino acid aminotransferase [Rhodobacterales bacterium]|nr:MAG: branched chain amino acid aminotransferase [Rhodobacterales bacterium]
MAVGTNLRTYFEGSWHEGDVPVMRAGDHGAWLGSTVFDGARYVDGIAPDLDKHLARVNRSAEALLITPTVSVEEMLEIVWEGLRLYPKDAPVYVRPMYWGIDSATLGILPSDQATGFAVCLEVVPIAPAGATTTLGTTRFRRPVLDDAVVNAKAGSLYPNNARMIAEVSAKGFGNALVADALGNVAESASANVFMVKDGVLMTPVANGTFLSGITRARHISNARAAGIEVQETVLTFEDFRGADEVFLSGNMHKVTPVTEFEGTHYRHGPVTERLRDLYWDWAHAEAGRP